MLLSHLASCHGDTRGCAHMHVLRCIANLLPRLASEMPAIGRQVKQITQVHTSTWYHKPQLSINQLQSSPSLSQPCSIYNPSSSPPSSSQILTSKFDIFCKYFNDSKNKEFFFTAVIPTKTNNNALIIRKYPLFIIFWLSHYLLYSWLKSRFMYGSYIVIDSYASYLFLDLHPKILLSSLFLLLQFIC